MQWLAGLMGLVACGLMAAASTAEAAKKAEEWTVQKGAEFLPAREADGDSFGMRVLFMKDLEHLENSAKRAGLGLWKKPPAPGGRFR